MSEEDDRDAILARRNLLIAAAMAGVLGACTSDEPTKPSVCLTVVVTTTATPTACLTVSPPIEPPPSASVSATTSASAAPTDKKKP